MRKHGWRLFAWVAAAAMGSVVAGCGDDTGTTPDFATQPGMDMAMQVGNDLSMPGADMALGPGSGQALAVDVVGTAYTFKDADAGTENSFPGTHLLITSMGFPDKGYPSDVSGVVVTTTPPKITGCDANWYDNTSATGHHSHPDQNVGTITVTGYNTKLMVPGPRTMTNPLGLYGPIPDTVACGIPSMSVPFYGCVFAKGAGTTPVDNLPTNGIAFGAIPRDPNPTFMYPGYNGACTLSGAGCCTGAGCTGGAPDNCTDVAPGPDPFGGPNPVPYCLQDVWTNGAGATNSATITIPGGNGYSAFTANIKKGGTCTPAGCLPGSQNFPENLTIVGIKVGTTALSADATTGLFSLDQLDGHLDGNNDVQIQWACTPPTCTTFPCTLPAAGAGCTSNASITNYVSLAGITSEQPRAAFALGPKYGTLTCFEQTTSSTATVTVPAMAVKTFMGIGQQTGGSAQLILMNIEAAAILASPKQLAAAGHGQFALLNHP